MFSANQIGSKENAISYHTLYQLIKNRDETALLALSDDQLNTRFSHPHCSQKLPIDFFLAYEGDQESIAFLNAVSGKRGLKFSYFISCGRSRYTGVGAILGGYAHTIDMEKLKNFYGRIPLAVVFSRIRYDEDTLKKIEKFITDEADVGWLFAQALKQSNAMLIAYLENQYPDIVGSILDIHSAENIKEPGRYFGNNLSLFKYLCHINNPDFQKKYIQIYRSATEDLDTHPDEEILLSRVMQYKEMMRELHLDFDEVDKLIFTERIGRSIRIQSCQDALIACYQSKAQLEKGLIHFARLFLARLIDSIALDDPYWYWREQEKYKYLSVISKKDCFTFSEQYRRTLFLLTKDAYLAENSTLESLLQSIEAVRDFVSNRWGTTEIAGKINSYDQEYYKRRQLEIEVFQNNLALIQSRAEIHQPPIDESEMQSVEREVELIDPPSHGEIAVPITEVEVLSSADAVTTTTTTTTSTIDAENNVDNKPLPLSSSNLEIEEKNAEKKLYLLELILSYEDFWKQYGDENIDKIKENLLNRKQSKSAKEKWSEIAKIAQMYSHLVKDHYGDRQISNHWFFYNIRFTSIILQDTLEQHKKYFANAFFEYWGGLPIFDINLGKHISILDTIIKLDPTNINYFKLMGELLHRVGNIEGAIEYYEKSNEADKIKELTTEKIKNEIAQYFKLAQTIEEENQDANSSNYPNKIQEALMYCKKAFEMSRQYNNSAYAYGNNPNTSLLLARLYGKVAIVKQIETHYYNALSYYAHVLFLKQNFVSDSITYQDILSNTEYAELINLLKKIIENKPFNVVALDQTKYSSRYAKEEDQSLYRNFCDLSQCFYDVIKNISEQDAYSFLLYLNNKKSYGYHLLNLQNQNCCFNKPTDLLTKIDAKRNGSLTNQISRWFASFNNGPSETPDLKFNPAHSINGPKKNKK